MYSHLQGFLVHRTHNYKDSFFICCS